MDKNQIHGESWSNEFPYHRLKKPPQILTKHDDYHNIEMINTECKFI